jgi:DNA (cytosine-5)-methyltransferase 1
LFKHVPACVGESVINEAISETTRDSVFDRIDAQLALRPAGERTIDVIVGGPPCQTFSVAGRARVGVETMENDPRSLLAA